MNRNRNHARGTAVLAGICAGALLTGSAVVATATPTSEPINAGPVSAEHTSAGNQRGAPVSVTPLPAQDAAAVREQLKKADLDTSRVRSGVRGYRVVYRTVSPDGRPTTASSLLAVPDRRVGRLHQAMWLHGTTLYRGGVASMTGERTDRPSAYAIAAAGYAVTAPDYLGLGKGPGSHPYIHLPSTASASVDALRATRAVLAGHTRLSREVLLTGHSQGGSAVMAVGRALPKAGLRAGVLAPLSGPFDIGRLITSAVNGRIPNGSAYLAYLTIAWNRLHHFFPSDAAMFRAPYRTVPRLFDGHHPETEVLPTLPTSPTKLFTDELLAWLRQPTGALRAAVRQASSACDWRPGVPVTLYTASGDRDVPPWNARYCQRALGQHGGDAEVVDLGNADHSTMALRALPRVLASFDEHTR